MSNERNVNAGTQPICLLLDLPEFWWMSEAERAYAFEIRARAHGGQGYGIKLPGERERER